MVIFLSGMISGRDNFKGEFERAEKYLTKKGHIVLNPAKLPQGMPDEKYMPICLAMLEQADAVYFLPTWFLSNGSAIERAYAMYQGKEILNGKVEPVDE